MEKKIGVIRGDGSSPEIVLEALRVLQKLNRCFTSLYL